MTDTAYSILLFAGLVSGPASAFIVGIGMMPAYVLFPLMALLTPARKGMMRILPLVTAPLFVLLWGILTKSDLLVERSLRWCAAVCTGASMSGALGASRASQLLFSLSRRVHLAGLPESLAMIVSLAGPFSRRAKEVFIGSRKNGRSLTDSFEDALSSIGGMRLEAAAPGGGQSAATAWAAVLAWIMLLAGIMGAI